MWTLVVAPLNLVTNDQLRLIKCLERVLPDTLFLEISKEPFNDPVLMRCVGCNELLLQPIVTTGLPEVLWKISPLSLCSTRIHVGRSLKNR
jgi:hypothetical protein